MNLECTGLFIASRRKEINLTQKELAGKIGVTDKAVSRWETGKGFPDVSLLIPLAEVLGVSVSEIIAGEQIEEQKAAEIMDKTVISTIEYTNQSAGRMRLKCFVLFIIGFTFCIWYNYRGVPNELVYRMGYAHPFGTVPHFLLTSAPMITGGIIIGLFDRWFAGDIKSKMIYAAWLGSFQTLWPILCNYVIHPYSGVWYDAFSGIGVSIITVRLVCCLKGFIPKAAGYLKRQKAAKTGRLKCFYYALILGLATMPLCVVLADCVLGMDSALGLTVFWASVIALPIISRRFVMWRYTVINLPLYYALYFIVAAYPWERSSFFRSSGGWIATPASWNAAATAIILWSLQSVVYGVCNLTARLLSRSSEP